MLIHLPCILFDLFVVLVSACGLGDCRVVALFVWVRCCLCL